MAILLMYAAHISGDLADYDRPRGLIWEMWVYIISPVKTCGGYKGGRDRGDLN